MGVRTVPQLLGMLRDDPDDLGILQELREVVKTGKSEQMGDDPMKHLRDAMDRQAEAGEHELGAALLELAAGSLCENAAAESELRVDLGVLYRDELMDDEAAQRAFARAVELDPNSKPALLALQTITQETLGLSEAVERLLSSPKPSVEDRIRAAALLWQHGESEDRERAETLFTELVEECEEEARPARVWARVLRSAGRWKDMEDVLATSAIDCTDTRARLSFALRAGRVAAGPLEDMGAAESHYRIALSQAPSNGEALRVLVGVYTDAERWKDLVAVYEGALDLESTTDPEAQIGILTQLAMVHWRILEQPADAAPYFARLRKWAPEHPSLRLYEEEFGQVELEESDSEGRESSPVEPADSDKATVQMEARGALALAGDESADTESPDTESTDTVDSEEDAVAEEATDEAASLADESSRESMVPPGKKGRQATKRLRRMERSLRKARTPAKRAQLMANIARFQQDGDQSIERTIEAWKRVLEEDSSHVEARKALKDLYRVSEKWNALVESIQAEISELRDDETSKRIALLRELIPVYRDGLGLGVMVAKTYKQLLRLEPGDLDALDELCRTHEEQKRWNDLIQALGRRADVEPEPQSRIVFYRRIAALWIERFKNYNQARRPLESVLEIDPDHRETLGDLRMIYGKKRAWQPLCDVLQREAQLTSDPEARAELLRNLAELVTEKLSDPKRALVCWSAVFELNPEDQDAEAQVARLAERQGEWAMLAAALESRVSRESDAADRMAGYKQLGAVYADRLEDYDSARRVWESALELEPENARVRRALRDILVRSGDWDALERVFGGNADWDALADVLGKAAEAAKQPETVVALSLRAAAVYRDKLDAPQRAFRHYERILKIDPSHRRAAECLIPIYEREEKWTRLPGLLELMLDNGPDSEPDQATESARKSGVMLRLYTVCREQLGDQQGALRWALLATALGHDEEDWLSRLELVADTLGEWETLCRALEARSSKLEGEALYENRLRIASLLMEKAGDREGGQALLEELLAERPGDLGLMQSLQDAYEEAGASDSLLGLFRHRLEHGPQDGAVQVEVLLSLAELEEAAGRTEEATQHYRAIVDILPGDITGLESLDRLATTRKAWDELVDVLERRAEAATDEDERVAFLSRLVAVHFGELKDAAAAMDVLEAAYNLAPEDDILMSQLRDLEGHEDTSIAERAAELLEERYESAELWDELAGLLGRRRRRTEDPEQIEAIQLRLAELAGEQLGDYSAAFEVLQSAFLTRPDDEALERRLERAAERSDNQSREADLYAQVLKGGSLGNNDAVRFGMKRARLLLGDEESGADAEAQLRQVLDQDATHNGAFEALKERLTTDERWPELREIYGSRIEATLDAADRVELLLQISGLIEDVGDDDASAYAEKCFREVLDIEPGNAVATRRLERHYRQAESWRELADLLAASLPDLEGQDRVDTLLELAEIEGDRESRAGVALESLEAILDDNPRHLKAQERVHRLLATKETFERAAELLLPIYEEQGAWNELNEVLSLRFDTLEEPSELADDAMRLAEIAELRLHDTASAFAWVSKAIQADPARGEVRGELERLAVIRDEQSGRAEVLEKALKSVEDDAFIRAEILEELAKLHLELLDNEEQAEAFYKELIACDEENLERVTPAYRALRRIHRATGNDEALVHDLERLAELASDQDESAELWQEAAGVHQRGEVNEDRAIFCYRRFLEIRPDNDEATNQISNLLEARESWDELIDILESIDADALSDDAHFALAERISEVYSKHLEDNDRALAVLEDAVAVRGPTLKSMERLAKLYRIAERWSDLAEVLRQGAPLAENDAAQRELLAELGQVLFRHLDESEAALDVLDDLLAENPDAEGALETVSALCSGSDEPYLRQRAAKVLARAHAAQDRYSALLASLDILTEADEPAEQLEHLSRGYRLVTEHLGGGALALDWLLRSLRVGAALDSDEFEGLVAEVSDLASATDGWPDVVERLESCLDEMFLEERRVRTLSQLGSWCLEHLEDSARAQGHYESLLEIEPENPAVLESLQPLLLAAGDQEALCELLGRRAESELDVDKKVELMLQRAALAESELSDGDLAVDVAEESMQLGASVGALDILSRIYTSREDWFEMAGLLERAMEAHLRPLEELHHELAVLAATHLDDAERALEHYGLALAERPGFARTVDALLELTASGDVRREAASMLEAEFGRQESWGRVAEMLEVQAAASDDPEEKRDALRRLGVTQEECREDLGSALEAYARFWAEDPTDTSGWQTFQRVAKALDRPAVQARLQADVLNEVEFDDELTSAACELTGELLQLEEETRREAIPFFERVLRFSPASKDSYEALATLREEFELWPDLVEQHRAGMSEAESDAGRAELGHRLAVLLEERLDDAAGALDLYREMFETDRADKAAADSVERLLTHREAWDDLAEFLADRAVEIESQAQRLETLMRQARVIHDQLGDGERALDIAREALEAEPRHEEFLALVSGLLISPECGEAADEVLEGVYRISDDWSALSTLLESRSERREEPRERAELLREAAVLLEERGGDHARALEFCSRAFVLAPDAGEPLAGLLRLADYQGAWESIAAVLEAGVPRAENSEDAADILGELAYIQDTRRGDPRGASRSYKRIIQMDPDREEAVEHYESLVVMLGDWKALASLLLERAEMASSVEEKSGLFRRAGVIHDEMLGDAESAIQAFRDALTEDDRDVSALVELDRLYVRSDNYESLAEILRQRLELTDTADDRVTLSLRLAMVTQHELERPEEAASAYQRVLDDAPEHLAALEALAGLYKDSESWDDLLDILASQIEVIEAPAERGLLMIESGDICREHLDRFAEALDLYRDALADIEGAPGALHGLADIGRRESDLLEEVWPLLEGPWASAGNWDEMAGYLERMAEYSVDEEDKLRFSRRLVEVHETQRGDAEAAFEVLMEIAKTSTPDELTLTDVLRVGKATERWAQTVDVMETAAEQAENPSRARELWLQAADLAEVQWGEPVRAITAYERAGEVSGADLVIWEGLVRCHEAMESWDDLVEVLETWASGAQNVVSRHEAMVRMAVVRAERFGDRASSMAVVRDIVDEAPEHEAALAALVGFTEDAELSAEAFEALDEAYRRTESFGQLTTLYDLRIDKAGAVADKRTLMRDAAQLWQDSLGDHERALSLIAQSWRLEPGDEDTLLEMEALAEKGDIWGALRGVIESVVQDADLDAWVQRDLMLRAADWYGEKLEDLEAAETALRGVVKADPSCDEGYSRLLEVLGAQEKSAESVEVMMAWARVTHDEPQALELFAEAAQLAEATLGDTSLSTECYLALIKRKPGHPDYLSALVRLRRVEQNWGALAERLAELVAVTDGQEERASLRHQLAELYRGAIPNRQGAIDVYRAILEDAAEDRGALMALTELFEEAESWDELATLLERRIAIANQEDDSALGLLLRRGDILLEKLHEASEASEVFARVRETDPQNEHALSRLDRIFRSAERWADLRDLLLERATFHEMREDIPAAVACLLEVAELSQHRLEDEQVAIEALTRLLEWDAQHAGGLSLIEEVFEKSGRWEELLDFLDERLEVREGEDAIQTALRIASLAQQRLQDVVRAESALRYVMEASPAHPEALQGLRDNLSAAERWIELADLERSQIEYIDEGDVQARKNAWLEIAAIYGEKAGEAVEALTCLEKASETDPEDRELLDRLCDAYVSGGRSSDAIPVLEQIVATYGGRRSKEAAVYYHRLGRAKLGIGDESGALEQFDAAFRIDLTNVDILRDLGQLCLKREDFARAQKTFRALLLQRLSPDAGLVKADVYAYIGECQLRLGELRKAKSMLRRALDEEPQHERAQTLLAEVEES